jgi:hypothetical protein
MMMVMVVAPSVLWSTCMGKRSDETACTNFCALSLPLLTQSLCRTSSVR